MKKIHACQSGNPRNIHALAQKKSLNRGNVGEKRFMRLEKFLTAINSDGLSVSCTNHSED